MSTQEDYDDDDDDGELREEPLLIPPLNFAMVNSGIYRSGYPNKKVIFFYKKHHHLIITPSPPPLFILDFDGS
jgi:hypothetical protein